MDYVKTVEATEAQCYGVVYHPVDKTVTFCYRGAPKTIIQPDDFTDAQKSAVKAFAVAFGVGEFKVTKEDIETDIDTKIAEVIAIKEEPAEPKEVTSK